MEKITLQNIELQAATVEGLLGQGQETAFPGWLKLGELATQYIADQKDTGTKYRPADLLRDIPRLDKSTTYDAIKAHKLLATDQDAVFPVQNVKVISHLLPVFSRLDWQDWRKVYRQYKGNKSLSNADLLSTFGIVRTAKNSGLPEKTTEENELPTKLTQLVALCSKRCKANGISLKGLAKALLIEAQRPKKEAKERQLRIAEDAKKRQSALESAWNSQIDSSGKVLETYTTPHGAVIAWEGEGAWDYGIESDSLAAQVQAVKPLLPSAEAYAKPRHGKRK